MKSHASCFLGPLIKLFSLFYQSKELCRIMASVVKTTMTKILIRDGLNNHGKVGGDNTGFCF